MARVSRREAVREATRRDILDAARKLLASGGPSSVTLRAVAGEIGMTAPGLYRYFPSHEALLLGLTDAVVGELADAIEATAAAHEDDPAAALLESARAFRAWCLDHKREFQLAFGLEPAPPGTAPAPHCDNENVRRMCRFFFMLFVRLHAERGFAVPPPEALHPELCRQLHAWHDQLGGDVPADVPLGLVKVFAEAWVRLYGIVAMEVFGHLRFLLTDVDALFETMLAEYGELLVAPGDRGR
ncbi:MAG TPA: TetR/AcrR family transcriptional regulator [Streptosporangiales bacterium]